MTLICGLGARQVDAQDGGLPSWATAGLKLGGELVAKQFAAFVYRSTCQGREPSGAGGLICGAVGSFSGDKEREWKESVTRQLGEISGKVDRLQAGLDAVRADQQQLLNQNAQMLVKLDEIVAETVAGASLARVRTLWEEQYTPFLNGERSFDRERLLAFARQVIFDEKVHTHLGQIHDSLVRGQIGGKPSLLRLYTQRIATRLGTVRSADLEIPYRFLESVMTELLNEQRKGGIIYLWAASVLQADCEVNQKCEDAKRLPHTAVEYETLLSRHLQEQLAEFDVAIEWLVLAGSDPHSRQANFLHGDASRIFFLLDLFGAANRGQGFGLVGRVISMGDSFDGSLGIGSAKVAPRAAAHDVPTTEAVDWWLRKGEVDEIRFANQWRVFPYHLPAQGPGTYPITTSLPVAPQDVRVVQLDLKSGQESTGGGSAVTFGSFVAVARKGGGYALLEGPWDARVPGWTSKTVVGVLSGDPGVPRVDVAVPRLAAWIATQVKWDTTKVFEDQRIEGRVEGAAVRRRKIVAPDGGNHRLTLELANAIKAICPDRECNFAEVYSNSVLYFGTDFSKPPLVSRSATMSASVGMVLGGGSNGVLWTDSLRTDNPREAHKQQNGPRSEAVSLSAGKPVELTLDFWLELNTPTSGLDATRFWLLCGFEPSNAYLSR